MRSLTVESKGDGVGRLRPNGQEDVHGSGPDSGGRPRPVQHRDRVVQTVQHKFGDQSAGGRTGQQFAYVDFDGKLQLTIGRPSQPLDNTFVIIYKMLFRYQLNRQ